MFSRESENAQAFPLNQILVAKSEGAMLKGESR
jgi:hypothetical protein